MTAEYHAVAYKTRHHPQPRRHVVKSLQEEHHWLTFLRSKFLVYSRILDKVPKYF